MQRYHLADDFTDVTAEQSLLASIAYNPDLYWTLYDHLSSGVFTHETNIWDVLATSIEEKHSFTIPSNWIPAIDPHTTAQRLIQLSQRRLLAVAQERLAEALYDESTSTTTLASLLEDELLRIQTTFSPRDSSSLQWAHTLLSHVLAEATARRQQREATGVALLGVATGLPGLDDLLGGLTPGLHLFAGPPGSGKTTFTLQVAMFVAQTIPVIFVTFEHAPANLLLKALCIRAGLNPQHVQRGLVDLKVLHQAAANWEPIAQRLALVEGSSQLTIPQIRAQTRRALQQHHAKRCLVIVDYLQLWAKIAEDLRHESITVRERVEVLGGALRQLALQLQCPVVAVASQNRAQGHYGMGKGVAALDSLKESGDLEYTADTVLFLTESTERHTVSPARAVDLTIAKHRHGETGKIPLIFRPDIGIMREEASV